MKLKSTIIVTLSVLLIVALGVIARIDSDRRRVEENYRAVEARNRALGDSLQDSHTSVARLRMTIGELEEFRARDAAEIEQLGLKLRHTKSLTKVESELLLDTTILEADTTFRPLLSDSLFHLRWSDGWVALDVTSGPTLSRVEVLSRDTLLQVVHRVPHRWWIFAWGTKAVRQEIRSSNPHTRLHYAEYIELE